MAKGTQRVRRRRNATEGEDGALETTLPQAPVSRKLPENVSVATTVTMCQPPARARDAKRESPAGWCFSGPSSVFGAFSVFSWCFLVFFVGFV